MFIELQPQEPQQSPQTQAPSMPAHRQEEQQESRKPSRAVIEASSSLLAGSFDFDRTLVLDRRSENLSFFLGDYHSGPYRTEARKTINYLIENAKVRRVGLEGVWGEPREDMLEDRYRFFERLYGKEVAEQKRRGEKELFEPVMDLLQQKVTFNDEKIEAFGLENEKFFLHAEVCFEQGRKVPELLKRLNAVIAENPERFRGKSMKEATEMLLGEEGDEEAREIDEFLTNMVTRIKNDSELAEAIGDDPPLYNHDIFESPEVLLQFQRNLRSAERRYLVNARDLFSRDLHDKFRATEGNTVFFMGWAHVHSVAQNVRDSALVVHPIPRGHELREKEDPDIEAVLKYLGVNPPMFLRVSPRPDVKQQDNKK